ncbi:MAG: type II secretion system protein [Planctomycetes bacterium]|nr:type II secretion system protein [Planctomycetota bacterium]
MPHATSSCRARPAFTVIELLVVVSIIALLMGILLPAIGRARAQARLTMSQANLRNLATAHASYAAEWSGRQFTLVNDRISTYGVGVGAFHWFYVEHGGVLEEHTHPGPILGWGYLHGDPANSYLFFAYRTHESGDELHGTFNTGNAGLNLPVDFNTGQGYFGSFRLINVQQFNQYVSGRFYDRVFYAPKDRAVWNSIAGAGFEGANCFDDPGQYCDRPGIQGLGELPFWSSYCLSPAAMFAPQVMARDDPDDPSYNGWRNPWALDGGHRSPSLSQALHPSLKTHMLEHHWLQNVRAECNPGLQGSGYVDGCEPYYFNHAWQSTPATLFYDGHVGMVGVRNAMRADARMRAQSGGDWGLWSRDTPWGDDGYLISFGYDQADTSFHILTTDGIRGRDVVAP